MYQNVRGFRSKCNEFYESVVSANNNLIFKTETWLNDSIFDRELTDNRYMTFRNNRNYNINSTTRGGGVMILVKEKYRPILIEKSDSASFEWISVKVTTSKHNNVFGIYSTIK